MTRTRTKAIRRARARIWVLDSPSSPPPRVCACGSREWIACRPGSVRQITGNDPNVLLLHPIAAVPDVVWCAACWPWRDGPCTDAQRRATP